MVIDAKLKQQLIRHEGIKLKPYKCTAGKLTIGIGRNLEDVGITAEEAHAMLDTDIKRVIYGLENNFDIFNTLPRVRKNVLINMAFNLGLTGISKFKKMWEAIEMADYKLAAREMLDSRWATQVGGRAIELSEQMESGHD